MGRKLKGLKLKDTESIVHYITLYPLTKSYVLRWVLLFYF